MTDELPLRVEIVNFLQETLGNAELDKPWVGELIAILERRGLL